MGLIQKILGTHILLSVGFGLHPNDNNVSTRLGFLTGTTRGGGMLQVLPFHSITETYHQ